MRAWEDVRTIVLLVVVILFASPAFFDDVLARDPRLGVACEVAGLAFAVALSEVILRGLAIRLPVGFRIPYHLFLALFYLHPVALAPVLGSPENPAVAWGLFAFPMLAGAITLTLLPAARRGASYVAKDGTPWRWPLYPWTLFVFVALSVCVRSATHCLSVNYSGGTEGYEGIDGTVFGPYFLVPFGLAVAAVLIEVGLAASSRATVRAALVIPMVLVGIASVGHRPDPVYQRFLGQFVEATGGTPMFVALAVAAGFYAMSAWRGVRGAIDLMTVSVAAMSLIGPSTLDLDRLTAPQAAPLLAAALIQGALAIVRRDVGRGLISLVTLSLAAAIGPVGSWGPPARLVLAAYLAIGGLMLLGALCRGRLASVLRGMAVAGLIVTCLLPLWTPFESSRLGVIVPMLVAVIYGAAIGDRRFLAAVGLVLICWAGRYGGLAYASLRRAVPGLDQITLGLAFFLVAAVISMAKAGALPGTRRDPRPLDLADEPAG
jgi:hypothetical protein